MQLSNDENENHDIHSEFCHLWNIRGYGLGPLKENDTTYGAMMSSSVSATRIVATGFLKETGRFSFIKMHDAEKGILVV